MPLAAQNRAPEAFDDTIEVVAGSAPLVLDVLDNDSDPDGDRILVTQVGTPSSGEAAVVDGGGAVEFTPPGSPGTADGGPAELAFNYSIDDGRGGTASATVEVVVIPSTDPAAPIAVDDQVGPVGPGQTVEIDLLTNDLDPDGNPAELDGLVQRPGAAQLDGGTLTFTAGPVPAGTATPSPTPPGSPTPPSSPCSSSTNRAPVGRAARGRDARPTRRSPSTSAPGVRPGRRHAYFVCCDGRAAAPPRRDERPERADGAVQPRRPVRRPGDVLLHRRRPEGAHRRRLGDRERAPAEQPPADGRRRQRSRSRPAGHEHRPRRPGHDPDPGETFQFTTTPASAGVVQLRPDGATVRATAGIDQAGGTDSFQYTVTDSGGESATATVNLTVAAPDAPPPQARPDSATTNQATPVTVAVLANDIDPLGQGLTVTSVGASERRHRDHRRPPGHVQPEQRLLRDDDVPVPGPRRLEHRPAGSGGPGHGQRHRPSIGARLADGGRRQRHRHGQLGRPGRQRRADRRLRDPHRRGRRPVHRQHDRVHVDRADQRRRACSSACGRTTSPAGVRGAVRHRSSPPTSNPVARPRRRSSSPTARSSCRGTRRRTKAARSPTTTSRSAAAPRPSSGSAPATSFTWTGLQNGTEYTFLVRAVNAKGEGQWSSPSAPEHPLRAPRRPAAPVGHAATGRSSCPGPRRTTAATRSSSTRCRSRAPAPPTSRRRRRCSGRTCPTASRRASPSGPATGAGGARRRPPRSP